MRAVHRYEVPADGREHRLILGGRVVHVEARFVDVMEIWAIHHGAALQYQRAFQVFDTEEEIPDGATHVGSAFAPGGRFMRHLFEVTP